MQKKIPNWITALLALIIVCTIIFLILTVCFVIVLLCLEAIEWVITFCIFT